MKDATKATYKSEDVTFHFEGLNPQSDNVAFKVYLFVVDSPSYIINWNSNLIKGAFEDPAPDNAAWYLGDR